MEEENKEISSLEEESAILKEYKKLQENTVSKEKYEADTKALKDKADLYLKAITEGQKINTDDSDSEFDLNKEIEDISKFKGTNLEYWKKITRITDKLIKTQPENEITKITGPEGLEELVKVNDGMKKMVEDSNGDPDYFRTLYKNRVVDSAPRISAEVEKNGGLVGYLQNKK